MERAPAKGSAEGSLHYDHRFAVKILAVSAHYPPNFVSGGTLAPQRVARGMRRRGHDVEVFAGWLGDRPSLETWTEVDEEGVPVHWVATTPWTAWNDERNFDNPAVVELFADRLRRFAPDLVHVHSLQTLGGGIVAAAADAGVATVVTMHDFWWVCARQFLVDRDFVPCCPVVDAGVCPCEVDHDWLLDRNRRLRAQLASADLVLAVSSASRSLLEANGVGRDRLEVDENGLPTPVESAGSETVGVAEPAAIGPLRILFAGGADRMKGGHVLLDALLRLERDGRWSLTAYGLRPLAEELGHPALGRGEIDWRASFGPDEASSVFGSCDVVVVPSVMRESHSILTREALLHGRAVVVTDTFGPEEVVEEGRNGFVVPAGDACSLADVLRALVDDRALVAAMSSAETTTRIRPIDEQVDWLVRRFDRLLADRTAPAPEARPLRKVLFVVGIEGAPLRYRARLPAEGLALLGVEASVRHYRDPEAWREAFESDAVVIYRVPATRQVLQLLDALGEAGTPRFFDVDDLIFDPDLHAEIPALQILPPEEASLWMEGVRRYRTTMEHCDAFVGSTEAMCAHARDVVGMPAFRYANGVGMELGRISDREHARPRRSGPFRFGYLSGTDTHDHDWAEIEPAVVIFLERHPEAELWVGGLLRTSSVLDRFEARITRLPLLPWHDLPAVLRDLDVNLAPLAPDSRFNEAKSAIKWLEAALVGTPTIASPTEPFREAIRHGANGTLAATCGEWLEALEDLAADTGARRRIGERARRDALLEWSPHRQGRRYRDILTTPVELRTADPAWTVVSLDEPWASGPIPLDPYGPPEPPGGEGDRRDAVAVVLARRTPEALLRAGAQSLRSNGVRSTAGRGARFVLRRLPGRAAARRSWA